MGYRENPGWLSTAIGQGIDTFQQFRQLRDERKRREEDVAFRQSQENEQKKQARIAQLEAMRQAGELPLAAKKELAGYYGVESLGETPGEQKKRLTVFANTKSGEVDLSAFGGTKFKIAGGWENMSDVDRKTIGLPTGDEKKLAGLQFKNLENQGKVDEAKINMIPVERFNTLNEMGTRLGDSVSSVVLAQAAGKGRPHKATNDAIEAALAPIIAEQMKSPLAASLSEEERNVAAAAVRSAIYAKREKLSLQAAQEANLYELPVGRGANKPEAQVAFTQGLALLKQIETAKKNAQSQEPDINKTLRTINNEADPADAKYSGITDAATQALGLIQQGTPEAIAQGKAMLQAATNQLNGLNGPVAPTATGTAAERLAAKKKALGIK